jgi:hypothetical protein
MKYFYWNISFLLHKVRLEVRFSLEFENFGLEKGETIKNMYNRFIHIQNKFGKLGEILFNGNIIGKLLRVMLRKSRWKKYVSAFEAMQGVQAALTLDEVYAHLRSVDETLKQWLIIFERI